MLRTVSRRCGACLLSMRLKVIPRLSAAGRVLSPNYIALRTASIMIRGNNHSFFLICGGSRELLGWMQRHVQHQVRQPLLRRTQGPPPCINHIGPEYGLRAQQLHFHLLDTLYVYSSYPSYADKGAKTRFLAERVRAPAPAAAPDPGVAPRPAPFIPNGAPPGQHT